MVTCTGRNEDNEESLYAQAKGHSSSLSLHPANAAQIILFGDNAVHHGHIITLGNELILHCLYDSVDTNFLRFRIAEGDDVSRAKGGKRQRGNRDHIVVLDERSHAGAFGSKPQGKTPIQKSLKELAKGVSRKSQFLMRLDE
jgi:hypothetical protein